MEVELGADNEDEEEEEEEEEEVRIETDRTGGEEGGRRGDDEGTGLELWLWLRS